MVGKPEVIVGPFLPGGFERKTTDFRPAKHLALSVLNRGLFAARFV
jgi:hypothetical protein